MTLLIFLSIAFFCNAAYTHADYESNEVNRLEITPFYDAIIFSDVADVINEFENNLNLPVDGPNSDSESEETIDDLLTEYQHYLDKAHKQTLNYYEKTKTKNKVPALRHDRYSKTKPGSGYKYDDSYYSTNYYNPNKFMQPYNNPLDLFIPFSPKFKYLSKPDYATPQIKETEMSTFDKKLIALPSAAPKLRHDPIKPACVCKSGQYPCECKCKQCYAAYEPASQNNMGRKALPTDGDYTPLVKTSEFITDEKSQDFNDNTLNIKIKVDIQLPKMQGFLGKLGMNRIRGEDTGNSDIGNISSFNVPFPDFNFPIPMDLFGYKRTQKYSKHEPSPFHKITIHKKKKSRYNNNNKKHRKKLVAFHNVNMDSQQTIKIPYNEETYNLTSYDQKIDDSNQLNLNQSTQININNSTEKYTLESKKTSTNKTEEALKLNETQREDNIFLMVNISNNSENGTEDVHKTENSVEAEFTKIEFNTPTEKPLAVRKKRETSTQKIATTSQSITKQETEKILKITPRTNEARKADKNLLADAELLYWPPNPSNRSLVSSKNITMIILEREHKKSKLNMTKDTMRHNHTKVLERAIFGDVNWDDVDTVAPVFLSFVGKYIRGALTFCSQNVCHSMKCSEKVCVHRICAPNDRWNKRGHCAGSNITESVASLESIMDLPSNIAFEIVDILQNNMLGKLFGKVTLCISSKCISFVASKKNFLKSRCSTKDIGNLGHCPNVKTVKIV